MNKRILVYDLEIVKCIESKQLPRSEEFQFCAGWRDHANMGISVLTCYDLLQERPRVFMADNMGEFIALCEQRDYLVSFNGINFDNKVMAASGYPLPEKLKHYDILREVWQGVGLNPEKFSSAHGGFGLDEMAAVNLTRNKTGHGELAPVQWQRKQYGAVVDYCAADTWLTKQLFERVLRCGSLLSPKTNREIILSQVAIQEILA